MIYKYLALFLIGFSFMASGHAQEFDSTWVVNENYIEEESSSSEDEYNLIKPNELPGANDYQKENINKRRLSENEWEKVVGDQRFDEKQKEKEGEKKAEMPKGSRPWNSNLLRTISFVILILIVLALVLVVLRNIRLDSKVKKNTLLVQQVEEIDDIEQLETESLMSQALKAKNYRLAIRLVYLDLLKNLHESKIIRWKKDKTNLDYISELSNESFITEFRKITLGYELVWYGEREATENNYLSIKQVYETVYNQLNKQVR
jgi:hypothetical protein